MSQPKRYSVAVNDPWFGNGAYVAEDGKYVLYSDYAALAAENKAITEERDSFARLLRTSQSIDEAIDAWIAAKEGGRK